MTVTSSREARRDRRAHQEATWDSPAYMTPWTPDQDAELLNGRGTLAERAKRLGRTYYAAAFRIAKLRRQARAAK